MIRIRKHNNSHCCCFRDVKTLCISLTYDELRYHIQFRLWKMSQMNPEIQGEDLLKYDISEGEKEWLLDKIEESVSKAKSYLRWAVIDDNGDSAINERDIEDPESFEFLFMVDRSEWRGSAKSTMTYLDRYVVNDVLYEWCADILPDKATIYRERADDALTDAKCELNNYVIPTPIFRL